VAKRRLNIYLDDDQIERLNEIIKKQDTSVPVYIKNLVEKLIDKQTTSVLLSIPKNLTEEELSTWLQTKCQALYGMLKPRN
jgi:hypothetical protein